MIHVTNKARKWVAVRKKRKDKKMSERWFYRNTHCENEHPGHAVLRKSSSIETFIRALMTDGEPSAGWVKQLLKEVKD